MSRLAQLERDHDFDEADNRLLFEPDEIRALYVYIDPAPAYLQKPRRTRMKRGWRTSR